MVGRAFRARGNLVARCLLLSGVLVLAAMGFVYLAEPALALPVGYPSGPISVAIPDTGSASHDIVVGGTGTIADLNVALTVNHTWVGDLSVTLTHVDTGAAVTIIDRPGVPALGSLGCAYNDINATLDDEAASAVESQCATSSPAIDGTFSPNNPLSAFDGEAITGTWRLTVEDHISYDSGTLTGWALLFDTAPGLTIVKEAAPADDTPFEFVWGVGATPGFSVNGLTAVDSGPAGRFILRDPSDDREGLDLEPAMMVTELLPDGWKLDGISCDGDPAFWDAVGNTLFVHGDCDEFDPTDTLPPMQVCRMPLAMTCTFHNSAYGRIIVEKVVPEGAPSASFGFDPSWGGVFNMAGGAASMPFEVPAGVHSVSEVGMPEGWSQASAFCDDGSSPSAIGVSAGETVTCTFVNRFEEQEEGGSLTVIKRTTPAGGTGFAFDGTLGAFILDDGGLKVFEDLAAGPYTITESPATGWEFEDLTCFGAAGEVVDFTEDGSSVTVNLAEGQDVTCKFANREEDTSGPEGSLTIIKHTVPAGGSGFSFDAGALGTFTLDDGGSETLTDLAAGAYVVTESPAEGWEFASIECDALDFVVDGASVTVNLAEGEAAVCTFHNGELPYTGSALWLPLLLGGLAVLVMGLGAWTFSYVRQTERS